jgi:sugar phosphate isomerase/epimerase
LLSESLAFVGACAVIRLGICNELFEGWDFARVCKTVKELGYEGIEIAPFTLAPTINDLSAGRRRELRDIIHESGLETIGLHWLLAKTEGLYLTSPDAATRQRTADYLVALAEATRDLGGKLMVFGSPKQRNLLPGVDYHRACDYAAEVFSKIMPTVGTLGVDFCLEPLARSETDFLTSIAQAEDLIARVDHPAFKLHMDVKAQSSDPAGSVCELIARHAAEAGHFHAQDTNLRGPGMGDVEFEPIVRALVVSGYDRWISVEVFDYSAGAEETATLSIECLKRELAAAYADLGKHKRSPSIEI